MDSELIAEIFVLSPTATADREETLLCWLPTIPSTHTIMSSDTVYRRLAAEEINACQSYMRYAEKRLLEEGALAEVATRQLKRTNRYFWFYLFWVVLFSLNAVTGSAMYEGRSELVDVVYRSASLIGALIFAYIGTRRYWVTSLHMRRALSFLERANTTTAEKPTAPEM